MSADPQSAMVTGTNPEAPTFRENSEKMKKPDPQLHPVSTIV
jgi:hypothetical protein